MQDSKTARHTLLHRTTRSLVPTPEGQAYYERCQRILPEIEEAESEVMRFRDRPRGRLLADAPWRVVPPRDAKASSRKRRR